MGRKDLLYMQEPVKAFGYSVLVWIVCFIAATPFIFLNAHEALLHSAMAVVGSVAGLIAIFYYLKDCRKPVMKDAVYFGILLMLVNLALDGIILLRFNPMTTTNYIEGIGVKYLAIPLMAVVVAYALAHNWVPKEKEGVHAYNLPKIEAAKKHAQAMGLKKERK